MGIVWKIFFVAFCIVGILASIFNWEWFFELSRKFRRMDRQLGRTALRIYSAVLFGVMLFGYAFLSFIIR